MFPPRDALYQDYVGVFSWAAGAYRAGVYGGKITFLWAKEEPTIAKTWLPVVKQKASKDVEEHAVDGTHMSSVTVGIAGVAKTLSGCLNRLEQMASVTEHDNTPPAVSIHPLRAARPVGGGQHRAAGLPGGPVDDDHGTRMARSSFTVTLVPPSGWPDGCDGSESVRSSAWSGCSAW